MEQPIRVLVCGGRHYANSRLLFDFLDAVDRSSRIQLLVHGGASGADSIAGNWAQSRNIPIQVFPAQWNKFGKAAGMIRNREMFDQTQPDLVIAAPGGSGTKNMVAYATKNGFREILTYNGICLLEKP